MINHVLYIHGKGTIKIYKREVNNYEIQYERNNDKSMGN